MTDTKSVLCLIGETEMTSTTDPLEWTGHWIGRGPSIFDEIKASPREMHTDGKTSRFLTISGTLRSNGQTRACQLKASGTIRLAHVDAKECT
jgi:hypothetical protein